jgi:glycosyltransferase involved in cell wall biosynthesis
MKISLLVPSRNRVGSLKDMIRSVANTISNVNNVEILIAIDTDDKKSQENRESIEKTVKDLNVKTWSRAHSDYLNGDYYNWLAEKATGDYLWAIGDDVRFLSKDWDKILNIKVEAFLSNKHDRIAYITMEDGTEASHCCFPLITKEAFKVLHMFLHPQLMSWGADRTIHEIYGHPSIMREINIPDIKLNHLSYHDKKAPFDETAKSIKERFFRDPDCHNKVSLYVVPQQIKFLAKYIEEFDNGMVNKEQLL